MKQYREIYEKNTTMHYMFKDKFESNTKNHFEKDLLELLSEISELAYETKCYKYWFNKPPAARAVILEEYADVVMMTLAFAIEAKVELPNEGPKILEDNIVKQFLTIYKLATEITKDVTKEHMIVLFANVLNLGKLLGFSEEDIKGAVLSKINKTTDMFEQGVI